MWDQVAKEREKVKEEGEEFVEVRCGDSYPPSAYPLTRVLWELEGRSGPLFPFNEGILISAPPSVKVSLDLSVQVGGFKMANDRYDVRIQVGYNGGGKLLSFDMCLSRTARPVRNGRGSEEGMVM